MLDQDGDFNNGIQISEVICVLILENVVSIDFDQFMDSFCISLVLLMMVLEDNVLFIDIDLCVCWVCEVVDVLVYFGWFIGVCVVVSIIGGELCGFEVNDSIW